MKGGAIFMKIENEHNPVSGIARGYDEWDREIIEDSVERYISEGGTMQPDRNQDSNHNEMKVLTPIDLADIRVLEAMQRESSK